MIRERLKEPVTVKFNAMPLSQAIESLSNMVGVVMLLSNEGLEAEGHTPEVLVNFDLKGQEIPLKSVLNNILGPLKLTYTIDNDVLLITSSKTANTSVSTKSIPSKISCCRFPTSSMTITAVWQERSGRPM